MSLANNRITKVVVVGAGGNSGRSIAEALLATGKHSVTALTRVSSTTSSSFTSGINVVSVDYADKEALVAALRGQDALVITLSAFAPPETHAQLVEAAATAAVPWIIPNHWAHDTTGKFDSTITQELPVFSAQLARFEHIRSLGVSAYINIATGFWIELSLPHEGAFGFDLAGKKVTFYDDGETKIGISTLGQVGRTVASLLSLPVTSESNGPCLEDYRNKEVYALSFTATQKEIFESVLRVTGQKREEWRISYEPTKERFQIAAEAVQKGDMTAYGRMLYARILYPASRVGDIAGNHKLINEALGVPLEDLDTATRSVV